MADEADSKSVVGNHVRVQVPLPAYVIRGTMSEASGGCLMTAGHHLSVYIIRGTMSEANGGCLMTADYHLPLVISRGISPALLSIENKYDHF